MGGSSSDADSDTAFLELTHCWREQSLVGSRKLRISICVVSLNFNEFCGCERKGMLCFSAPAI